MVASCHEVTRGHDTCHPRIPPSKELRDRRCPLIIERTTAMKDNVKVIEAFRVRDMNIPFLNEETRPFL